MPSVCRLPLLLKYKMQDSTDRYAVRCNTVVLGTFFTATVEYQHCEHANHNARIDENIDLCIAPTVYYLLRSLTDIGYSSCKPDGPERTRRTGPGRWRRWRQHWLDCQSALLGFPWRNAPHHNTFATNIMVTSTWQITK